MDPLSVVGIAPPRVVRGPGGPFSMVGIAPPRVVRGPGGPLICGGYRSTKGC